MKEILIWHNSKCSKSREAKKILENADVPHRTFEYLTSNISESMLKDTMKMLSITDIKVMLRTADTLYKDLGIEHKAQDEIIKIVMQNTSLIQRPIIIKNHKAVIARPMENLIKLLKEN